MTDVSESVHSDLQGDSPKHLLQQQGGGGLTQAVNESPGND